MKQKSTPAAFLQHYKEFKARAEKYFLRIGHPRGELRQLWLAISEVKLTMKDEETGKNSPITTDRAIELLGEETFLSGISRCAFHISAVRTDATMKHSVSFDLSHWLH